jgi:hypothetical protein
MFIYEVFADANVCISFQVYIFYFVSAATRAHSQPLGLLLRIPSDIHVREHRKREKEESLLNYSCYMPLERHHENGAAVSSIISRRSFFY